MIIEVISLEYVSYKFNKIKIIDNLSLSINKGEIFGYLGENGAGKTTTMRMLTGLLKPDDGEVKILGEDPYSNHNSRKVFSCVMDTVGLYEILTVEENIYFYSSIYGMKKNKINKIMNNLIERLNIENKKDVRIHKLSKGMKQKVAIIRAFILKPEIIFLDEPTSNLDPLSQKEVKCLIKEYAREGITIFFNSHNLSEVEEICNKIGIIKNGRLIKVDTVDNMVSNYSKSILQVKVDNINKAYEIIKNRFPNVKMIKENDKIEINCTYNNFSNELNKLLVMSGISVREISKKNLKLDDIYESIMKSQVC